MLPLLSSVHYFTYLDLKFSSLQKSILKPFIHAEAEDAVSQLSSVRSAAVNENLHIRQQFDPSDVADVLHRGLSRRVSFASHAHVR